MRKRKGGGTLRGCALAPGEPSPLATSAGIALLENRGLEVGREDLAHDVGDLADRGVRLDRVDQGRHHVPAVGAGLAQGMERGPYGLAVARAAELLDGLLLLAFD